MKKLLLTALLPLLFGFQNLMAQDTFEEWKKQRTQEFTEFRDARDKEFMQMLDATWKAIGSMKGEDFYEEPKPEVIPAVAKPSIREEPPVDEPIIDDIAIPEDDFDLDSFRPVQLPPPSPGIEGYSDSGFDFYQVPVTFSFPGEINERLGTKIDKDNISRFWGMLGSSNYEPLLQQAMEMKEELALNDWGYALLVYRMGQQIYGVRANESVLFTWFMLTKAGYQSKVGYDQQGIYLLVPTARELYNTKFFRIDGMKHYALMLDNTGSIPSSIFTYDGTYPDADKKMDLALENSPKVKVSLMERDLSFDYNDQTYSVPVKLNRNVIAFYELYPLTELDIYFNAPISPAAKSSLVKALAPIIRGKSETEAVNILLRFVQTAFEYQTDQQQFGYEKYLLPEETLYYAYSDCDDRTIMFAQLVNELLGLDVVGLHYPGHLAAAVKFTKTPAGDYVTVNSQHYTVTDPTYVNANIGMTMPQYEGTQPEVLAWK